MSLALAIAVAGLLTYATRLSFIYLLHSVATPLWFRRALRFVPPAVLSAITLPELLVKGGAVALTWRNPELLSGALAILVAWRTKNVLLTIVVGMAVLVLLQALLPS